VSARARRRLLTVDAVVGIVAAVALLVVPELFGSLAGLSLASTGIVVARLYGAELAGFSVATWLARTTAPPRSGIVLGHVVNESLTAIVIGIGLASGLGGPVLAALALVAALLAVGFWSTAIAGERGGRLA
jgi:hypothetical protein